MLAEHLLCARLSLTHYGSSNPLTTEREAIIIPILQVRMPNQAKGQEALPEATPPVSILPHTAVRGLSQQAALPHACCPAQCARTCLQWAAGRLGPPWPREECKGTGEKQRCSGGRASPEGLGQGLPRGSGFEEDNQKRRGGELAFPLLYWLWLQDSVFPSVQWIGDNLAAPRAALKPAFFTQKSCWRELQILSDGSSLAKS